MKITNEKITLIDEKIAKYEQLRKSEVRKERKRQTKEQNRRALIVGRLVITYFPELSEIKLGKTNAENAENFKALEDCLKVISSDEKLSGEIHDLIHSKSNVLKVMRKSDRHDTHHDV